MIRLRRDDFEDPARAREVRRHRGHLARRSSASEFEYLIEHEPPPLDLEKHAAAARAEDGAHQH